MFASIVAASLLLFHRTIIAWAQFSLHDDSNSHILIIPFIALVLIYFDRKQIFTDTKSSVVPGTGLAVAGLLLFGLVQKGPFLLGGKTALCLETLAIILIWAAGFLLCYGPIAVRKAAFPLLFLILMVPIPDVILNKAIDALQRGSTEIAFLVFRLSGTPVYRDGFLITIPGITIEVAKECSSIRSSMAFFITCLLAAHLYLRTTWKQLLLVLISLPLSLVKNGGRIAALTLLSIHVDPRFLTGKLHHQGGFVFFLLALAILWPVFYWLERSERARASASSSSPEISVS